VNAMQYNTMDIFVVVTFNKVHLSAKANLSSSVIRNLYIYKTILVKAKKLWPI